MDEIWFMIAARSFFFCAAHATVTVHPLTDGWSHSRAVHHDNGSFPLTWLSHRWICRAVGRDQVRDDEFGTALIAAIHTGLAHVVVLTNERRNPNENLSWRAHRLLFLFFYFFSSFCFRFTGAVNCSIHKFELMTFRIPLIWNTSFFWFWITRNYLFTLLWTWHFSG